MPFGQRLSGAPALIFCERVYNPWWGIPYLSFFTGKMMVLSVGNDRISSTFLIMSAG
jgi:hypothetical protein